MVKVVWTDSAIQDINDIGEYIAKNSIRYAEITVQELFESVDILANHPKLGIIVPEFDSEFIRQLLKGNYRIVYQLVDEHRIDILTVHNGARLISNTSTFKKKK